MKEKLSKALPYIVSILFFIVISYAYFTPDIFEGKVLFQNDIQQGIALGEEARAFKEATGETSRWTNSAFSGMPTFQISPSYSSYPVIRFLDHLYSLWIAYPASLVFIMLTGFFIFMLAMGVKWHYAVIGAIAYAFSSYFFIIIEAGHIWKFITLAYIPPTLAGIVLAYKGRYWLGGSIAALFAMLQIASNHIQMTYYFLFVIVAFVIAFAVVLWQQKEMPRFWKASGVLAVAAVLAVGANLPNLYHTQKYSKETMRGGHSELTSENKNDENTSDGLNKDYITQWSYGKMETFSLLIPNIKGGASGALSSQKAAVEAAPAQVRPYLSQVNSYWGDQPHIDQHKSPHEQEGPARRQFLLQIEPYRHTCCHDKKQCAQRIGSKYRFACLFDTGKELRQSRLTAHHIELINTHKRPKNTGEYIGHKSYAARDAGGYIECPTTFLGVFHQLLQCQHG